MRAHAHLSANAQSGITTAATLTGPADGCDTSDLQPILVHGLGRWDRHTTLDEQLTLRKSPFSVCRMSLVGLSVWLQSLMFQHKTRVLGIRIASFCNAPVASGELWLSILKLDEPQ